MLVDERGKNADSPAVRGLRAEFQRLRRAGLADLTLRPRRYPQLLRRLHPTTPDVPVDMIGRLRLNAMLFDALLARLPSTPLRNAAGVLFHTGTASTPPPLDDRRRAADRAYTGRGYAREPDTVQRFLERDLLDPLLIDILSRDTHDLVARASSDRGIDYEEWEDDLQRATICVARQDFWLGNTLLERWLDRVNRQSLNDIGAYLHGRTLMVLADLRRDQGHIRGPLSAEAAYRGAQEMFVRLRAPRRVAQAELMLAVTAEMRGELDNAAARYRALADDERLSDLDRARAGLWIGTSLTKQSHLAQAVAAITDATLRFESLNEPVEWAVAHQKHALAQLAAGRLDDANRHIVCATEGVRDESPLQQVRLQVAHAHILLTDHATREAGTSLLNQMEHTATRYSLAHQLQAIKHLRRITSAAHRA